MQCVIYPTGCDYEDIQYLSEIDLKNFPDYF